MAERVRRTSTSMASTRSSTKSNDGGRFAMVAMNALRRWREVEHPLYFVNAPRSWSSDTWSPGPLGTLAVHRGNAHTLRVERALGGLVPIEILMAQVSLESRHALDAYEPGEDKGVVVVGAGPARR